MFLVSHLILQDHVIKNIIWLYRMEPFMVSYHPAKFGCRVGVEVCFLWLREQDFKWPHLNPPLLLYVSLHYYYPPLHGLKANSVSC